MTKDQQPLERRHLCIKRIVDESTSPATIEIVWFPR